MKIMKDIAKANLHFILGFFLGLRKTHNASQ